MYTKLVFCIDSIYYLWYFVCSNTDVEMSNAYGNIDLMIMIHYIALLGYSHNVKCNCRPTVKTEDETK